MGEIVKDDVVIEEEGTPKEKEAQTAEEIDAAEKAKNETEEGFGDAFGAATSTEEEKEEKKEKKEVQEPAGTGEDKKEDGLDKDQLNEEKDKKGPKDEATEDEAGEDKKGEKSAAEGSPDAELLKAAEDAGQLLIDAQGVDDAEAAQEAEEEKAAEEEEKVRIEQEKADKAEVDAALAKPKPVELPVTEEALTAEEKEAFDDMPEYFTGTAKFVLPQVREMVEKLVNIRMKQGKIDQGQTERSVKNEERIAEIGDTVDSLAFQIALAGVMPEAAETAKSKEYRTWISKQSDALKALHHSSDINDAVALLNLYQSSTKPKKGVLTTAQAKKEQERKDMENLHGHSVVGGGTTGKAGSGVKVEESDFGGAFKSGAEKKE